MAATTRIPVVIEPIFVNAAEAGQILSLSETTIRTLVATGEIRSIREGTRILIAVSGLRAWADARLATADRERAEEHVRAHLVQPRRRK